MAARTARMRNRRWARRHPGFGRPVAFLRCIG